MLWASALTSFLTPFIGSAINVALPDIQAEFQVNAVGLGWVAASYLLSTAVFLIPAGKLADIHGRKKVFTLGIAGFILSSLLCAAAPGTEFLIAARVAQGLSSSMIFSTGIAMLSSVFPPNERGRAIGITVGTVYIGLAVGPFLGGLIIAAFGWRGVFLSVIVPGAVALGFILLKVHGEWADARGEKLDVAGSLRYGAGLSLFMYGLSALPSPLAVFCLLCGTGLLVLFARRQLRIPNPVFEMRLFLENRTFAFSCLAALINYCATYALTFLLSLYLQSIRDLPPQAAGLILVAQPVTMALLSPLAGRLSDRIEPRILASAGMGVTCIGLLPMLFLSPDTPIGFILANLLLLGLGFALFSSPNTNAVMSAVPPPLLRHRSRGRQLNAADRPDIQHGRDNHDPGPVPGRRGYFRTDPSPFSGQCTYSVRHLRTSVPAGNFRIHGTGQTA